MAQDQGPGHPQHCFLRPRIGRKDLAGRHDSEHHRRRQAARQRRRRHQHLRLRRRRKTSPPLDRIDARSLRPRRQALQPDRHARLSRPHRPGARRLQAVETAAIVIDAHPGSASTPAGPFKRPARAAWAGSSSSTRWTPRTSTIPAWSPRSRNCSARLAFRSTCRSATGTISKAWSARSTRRSTADRRAHRSGHARIPDRSRSSKSTTWPPNATSKAEPSDEELSRLLVESIAEGHLIPILAVSGQNRHRPDRTARRTGPVRPAARQDRTARHRRSRRGHRAQGRSRPARWSRRSSRPASIRSCTS